MNLQLLGLPPLSQPLPTGSILLYLVAECVWLCDPMDWGLPDSSVNGDSPSKNTRVGCHGLLQGIFPTQGSNQHRPHWQVCSFPLCHLRNPGSWIFILYFGLSCNTTLFCCSHSSSFGHWGLSWLAPESLPYAPIVCVCVCVCVCFLFEHSPYFLPLKDVPVSFYVSLAQS